MPIYQRIRFGRANDVLGTKIAAVNRTSDIEVQTSYQPRRAS
jgi:hypothetical protein